MKLPLLRLSLPILVLSSLLSSAPAQPVPSAPTSSSSVPDPGAMVGPIMLRDESIDQVLVLLERWTGRTVLRPQTMPAAAITLSLRETVTKAEAIQAVETLLNLNGIALTPLGTRFMKATPLNLAKSEAPEFIEGSTLGLTPSGRVATKLFQLTFLRIGEFMPQIGGLLNPNGGSAPIVFEKTNSALITDSISNLQRVELLVAKLDQPMLAGLQPKFYPLSFAKASEVANKIRALFTGPLQSQIGSATTYNADDRTNQIILVSDPRQHAFFDELIAKLDVKSDPNTRNEVIYLKHAAAKDVAAILSQLVTGQNNAAKSAGADAARPLTGTATPAVVAPPQPAPVTPAANTTTVASLGLNL
ncbi:MAG TPA: secretin N-terminal domain-containing protein, partial [Lacunisphaera sp.]